VYEPTFSIWSVGRHQYLAGRAITHGTHFLANVAYDHLGEFPETPRLLTTKIVYKDLSRIVCDGDKTTCRFVEHRWQDLPTTYELGFGDCKCLVGIRLAECWREGREAYALARCYKCKVSRLCPKCQRPIGNGQTWHMQIVHEDGRIEDISRWLGMPPHPDGDDSVVAPFDQVGIVRLPRVTPGANGEPMNWGVGSVASVLAAAAAISTVSPVEEMVAAAAFGRAGRNLPAWVLQKAHESVERAKARAMCKSESGICAPTDKSPNPKGGPAQAGVASSLDYPWCISVEQYDNARNIAARITGDPSRHLEIIAANPKKPTVTLPNGEIDFAPHSLCRGERVRIARTMLPWVDQKGAPRFAATGERRAFPPYDTMGPNWRPA